MRVTLMLQLNKFSALYPSKSVLMMELVRVTNTCPLK